MRLSKKLTTVTPFSKYLALSLFVILPIIAYFFGAFNQKAIDQDIYASKTDDQINQDINQDETQIPNPTSVPQPTGIPAINNGYFTISQWHVRAPYNGPFNLEYSPYQHPISPTIDPNEWDSVFVSSAELNAGGPPGTCSTAAGAGGYIHRIISTYTEPNGESEQQYLNQNNAPVHTKIGNYYYIYVTGEYQSTQQPLPKISLCNNNVFAQQTWDAFTSIIPRLASY